METIQLEPNHEWRFEVGFKDKLVLKLTSGHAELFGTELAVGQEYEFSGQSAAIYSWQGCNLEYSGKVSEYTSEDTPMPVYANLHFALESLRSVNQGTGEGNPPVSVLCVGPTSSGKSSLAKILTAYALKQARTPLVVNLDPKSPEFSPPGGISATQVSGILDLENGWGHAAINGPSPIPPQQPLNYFFGLDAINKNVDLYCSQLANLSTQCSARLARDPQLCASGLIIDAPADFANDKQEYRLLKQAISNFSVNVLAVIGDERMYSDLTRRFKDNTALRIVKIPKSGGVVSDSDHSALRQVQHRAIQHYFYGTLRQSLSPFTLTARTNELTVYRVLEQSNTDMSMTSGDAGDYIADDTEKAPEYLTKVEVSSILQNCVLAMVNAAPTDPMEAVQKAEVLGYVHIVEADDNKKNLKILVPLPGRLPAKAFIMGDFRYHE